jgi:hypothetical protein
MSTPSNHSNRSTPSDTLPTITIIALWIICIALITSM